MIVAIEADRFGGVLGIIVGLVAAVMGPISIPMLLGLLPAFRRFGPRAALSSWALGLLGYVLVKFVLESTDQTLVRRRPCLGDGPGRPARGGVRRRRLTRRQAPLHPSVSTRQGLTHVQFVKSVNKAGRAIWTRTSRNTPVADRSWGQVWG